MYIWLLISKAERQAAGARAKAHEHKIPPTLLEKRAEHPPAEKQGRGIALSRYRDNASPLPCFPAGILERYRSHRTNHIADINKLLIEYQWNINRILIMSIRHTKWEAPWGAGRERGSREGAERADAMRLVALRPPCSLAGRAGGIAPTSPRAG